MRYNEKLLDLGYRMTRASWLTVEGDTGEVWVSKIDAEDMKVEDYALYNSQPLQGFYILGSRTAPAQPWTARLEDKLADDWEVIGGVQPEHQQFVDARPSIVSPEPEFVLDSPSLVQEIIRGLRLVQKACHQANVRAGWWTDLKTGEDLHDTDGTGIKRNTGELMLLVKTEISEAYEGYRKNLMDDHLPQHKMEAVELADAIYRIVDLAEAKGFDLGTILIEKAFYNLQRADHKPENRRLANGKKT